jgi:hypothetical protein
MLAVPISFTEHTNKPWRTQIYNISLFTGIPGEGQVSPLNRQFIKEMKNPCKTKDIQCQTNSGDFSTLEQQTYHRASQEARIIQNRLSLHSTTVLRLKSRQTTKSITEFSLTETAVILLEHAERHERVGRSAKSE